MCLGYGMGLYVHDDRDVGSMIQHSGGLPGYGSNMSWFPGHRLALVSMANITYAPTMRGIWKQ